MISTIKTIGGENSEAILYSYGVGPSGRCFLACGSKQRNQRQGQTIVVGIKQSIDSLDPALPIWSETVRNMFTPGYAYH